ncbi:MAG: DMT family transporter [Treponema sp.]|nr:DMT family transporter [Treponema sp.]
MINPKYIGISSLVGFFLSFFIGLISGVHFGQILLRALIFAVIFAGLYLGITFLYQKFLSIDNSVSEGESNPAPAAGGVVNIVVDDSNLPDDSMAPKFTVLNNKGDFARESDSSSDLKKDSAENKAVPGVDSFPDQGKEPQSSEKPAFKSVSLADGIKANDVQGAVPSSAVAGAGEAVSSSTLSQEEKLDELPDISNMSMDEDENQDESYDSADEVVSDTEFASGGSSMKEQPISGDTSVMAKAIQTLLAKDN